MDRRYSRRTLRRATGAALLAAALTTAAGAAERTGPYAPFENLIEALADFTRHLRDDVYRFAPPRDIVGRNLFAVTLERVDNFQTLHPQDMPDVVAFAKAEALVRLGRYGPAARAFERVAALADSPLAEPARTNLALVSEFARVSDLSESGGDLEATLAQTRAKLDAWDRCLERAAGTPYEPLARIEEERIEQRVLALIVENRSRIENGTETAVRSAAFLITKHAESRNAPAHVVRLGDLYADLAREYATEHAGGTFDDGAFNQRVEQALEVYQRIATLDGVGEKLEAQGKFAALQAYREGILASRH
jgi:hypothetical protein